MCSRMCGGETGVCACGEGGGCLNSSIKGAFQLLWKQFPAEGTLILKQGPASGVRLCVCSGAAS